MTPTVDAAFTVLRDLVLTLAAETGVALLLGVRDKRDLWRLLTVNVCTNLALHLVLALVAFLSGIGVLYAVCWGIGETVVVLAEYLFYRRKLAFGRIHPLLFSLILNASSVALGWIVYILL